MSQTFLAWNVENWGTVLLMAASGYLLFLVIVKLMQGYGGKSPAAS